jgi:hypothetical protein
MKFSTTSILIALAVSVSATSHFNTWSESGCKGTEYTWTVARNEKCKKITEVESFKVTDFGSGCTGTYNAYPSPTSKL